MRGASISQIDRLHRRLTVPFHILQIADEVIG
jgi:hypothetical protein